MISVVVVDDDPLMRRAMRALIERHASLALLGEAACAASAVETISIMAPDVIFLDIRLPGASGFEVLRDLPAPPPVVFVTCFREHSLQAFEFEALDYLVKPITPDRFSATVRRLERLFKIASDTSKLGLTLQSDGELRLIPFSQIIALFAYGDFTRMACAGGKSHLICRLLGEYDSLLPSPPFVRLDRSLIVNMEFITRMDRVSRKLCKLWLTGLAKPLDLGRTASERLLDNLVKKGRVVAG